MVGPGWYTADTNLYARRKREMQDYEGPFQNAVQQLPAAA